WKAYDTCSRCGYTTYVEIPKLGHDLVHHAAKAATCTEIGWKEYDTCSRCGYSTYEEIPALGHAWSAEWTTDAEATYDRAGSKSHHCVRCDAKTDVTEIPKLEKEPIDTLVSFIDVKPTSWFKSAVDYVVGRGLMNGVTADRFDPNGSMTRSMLVTVLYRMAGEPEAGAKVPFTDLRQDWYKPAVAWAYENGIVNGTSADKFTPNGAVTREQLAAILYRYSEYMGYDVTSRASLSAFSDAAQVHSWAKTALSWAVGEGLIGGVAKNGGSCLDPLGSATRAQVATILMRYCEKY
ncbi:MAG: S-layer homology domain-containing protein, partial [Clostridia bacterium]|nr:S-layer homology domain-containing protein [Clostridia bacterium]